MKPEDMNLDELLRHHQKTMQRVDYIRIATFAIMLVVLCLWGLHLAGIVGHR